MDYLFGPEDELDDFEEHGELSLEDMGDYALDDEEEDDLPPVRSVNAPKPPTAIVVQPVLVIEEVTELIEEFPLEDEAPPRKPAQAAKKTAAKKATPHKGTVNKTAAKKVVAAKKAAPKAAAKKSSKKVAAAKILKKPLLKKAALKKAAPAKAALKKAKAPAKKTAKKKAKKK